MNATKKKVAGDTMTAEEFRAILGRLGLTQAEAAEKLGFTRLTINNWVCGRHPITPRTVSHIRRVLLPGTA